VLKVADSSNRLEQRQLFSVAKETPLSAEELALARKDKSDVSSDESNGPLSERLRLPIRHPNRDFFLCDMFDYAIKDDCASMEAPIFTLATKPDLSTWSWKSKDGTRSVEVYPSVKGRAMQHDKDVLIYVISQLTEGMNRRRLDAANRTVRLVVHNYLVATNRGVSGDEYKRLQAALERLAGTRIATDIKTGGQRVKEGFGMIDSYSIVERAQGDGRMVALEVTLSKWLFNAIQSHEVLTINPNYFRLRKPLERRLYELARKHCGHKSTWSIGVDLLHEKCGSKDEVKGFRRVLREIIQADTLPDYRMMLGRDTVQFYAKDPKKLVAGIAKRTSKKTVDETNE
jgi:plasmid replication initiation protein